ncbi:biliverdin-producing heme oxygenase [Methylobacterium sp. J-068]|uniref:biliverdin-producing heme oxygenase n=1 Tax=Methylobacterium sp. J-068 TaxID=2836649 RepID=UPI001FB97260|nr:biliverdin-producing heme oxygenase [Methylobacterium sp. J-068]MCJ2032930.1 biliverdin-producing heme oxygenase [Methylobacterium sp. J-068]
MTTGSRVEAAAAEMRPGDLRFVLRDATQAAHRRLDAGFAAHDLTRRADYARFLTAMNAAFAPLEAWLDGADARRLPADWSARRRAGALRADLSGLGIADAGDSGEALPPTLSGAEAPGLLYVLEGSRLGGQVLLRQVLASPDPVVRENARFLRHGEGQRLWPSFAAWLGLHPVSEHADAIRGALRAFALFEAAQAAGYAGPR